MSKSEVARIREQIALEYQSAQRVFNEFSEGTAHAFLNKRAENLANHFYELQKHMTPEEAMQILIQEGNKNSNS